MPTFKCLDCNNKFISDGKGDVYCPECGSDNVKPYKDLKYGTIIKVSVFVVAALIGFGLAYMFSDKPTDTEGSGGGLGPGTGDTGSFKGVVVPPAEEENDPIIPIQIQIESQPIYHSNSKSYSFKVSCSRDGQALASATYSLYDVMSEGASDTVTTSTDGEFKNIQPTDSGKYIVQVKDNDTGQYSDYLEVVGFVIVKTVEKLTISQIQEFVDSGSADKFKNNAAIVPHVTFDLTDPQGESFTTQVFAELVNALRFSRENGGKRLQVTNLEYDKDNRVNKISVKIVY